jgi:hypothetical protein
MNPAPIKPTVRLDALEKLDIRVGTIESVSDAEWDESWVGRASPTQAWKPGAQSRRIREWPSNISPVVLFSACR